MNKYSKITQYNKFAIFLQYLKKEVRNGVHFLHADKHQSFYKLVLSFLVEVARHIQSTQNRKLVMCLQYLKKKVSQLRLCSIVMQNIQIFFLGSSHVLCYLYILSSYNFEKLIQTLKDIEYEVYKKETEIHMICSLA